MTATRFPWDLTPTDFARQQEAAEASDASLLDLTGSNPPALGLGPGPEHFENLDARALAAYQPDPRGSKEAREAVTRYLEGHGATLSPDDIVLAASTSEAYGWLFKVLVEPGASVAIPRPSYPLFDFLTHLEGVRPEAYSLFRDERWQLDRSSLERCLARGIRAVVLVQPSNPVGACLSEDDLDWLLERCGEERVPLLADEVFLDYGEGAAVRSLARTETLERARAAGVPLFILSGASKVVGAPQIKLGWIALGGAVTREVRARLELVADTYLSVSAAAQVLGARLLDRGAALRRPIHERLESNGRQIEQVAASTSRLESISDPAGWSAVLKLPPCPFAEGDWAAHLLDRSNVLSHPGHFYELSDRHLVLSLLTDPADLSEGLRRLTQLLAEIQQG